MRRCPGILLAVLAVACSGGLTRAEAIDVALHSVTRSSEPITVEFALDGPLDRFVEQLQGEDANRRVWAVLLNGAFEGEGVAGVVPRFRHWLVVIDFQTGEFIEGVGSDGIRP